VVLATTLVSLSISFYLAHLSGRATSPVVGDTFGSLELSTWSAMAGMVAMAFGVPLIAVEQTGSGLVRGAKLIATILCWFFLQVSACFLIESFSAP
jgi:hypothetical protein